MDDDAKVTISLFKPYIPCRELLVPALEATLYSGYISSGPRVIEFEQRFGGYIEWSNVVAVSSGTAALHLALLLAGVGPGDDVVSTPMTAEPTNLAILYTGANIVWADVEPRSGNISWKSVLDVITPRTKAVMMVDYSGIPAHGYTMYNVPDCIPIIEDAAHALGAAWDGQKVGQISEFTVFSFQAIKHLVTVDGGMLAVYGGDIERARRLRWFGIDRSQPRDAVDVRELGFKYNMNDVTATIGLAQMDTIDDIVGQHMTNGIMYEELLRNIPGVYLPIYDTYAEPSWWFFTIFTDTRETRDELMTKLNQHGVRAGLPHKRNDKHAIFHQSVKELPGLDWYWDHHLAIPCGWWMDYNDVERVAALIKAG